MEKQDKILKALDFWGFSDIKIIQQVNDEDSARWAFHVEADGKQLLIKGLPEEKTEIIIKGNTLAQEYLGNQKGLAPKLIYTPDGASYVKLDDYWFYMLEWIEGENLEETPQDEYDLAVLAKKLHSFRDYENPCALTEDKQMFYEWFDDKPFKPEFDAILDTLPDFKALDRCLIHTDLGPHNSVRNKQGEVMLIDLDDAGIGSRHLDLGWPFIMQFVDFNHDTEEMKYRFDLAESFLKGYYEGAELTRKEYDLLWHGAVYMHISYMQCYGPYAVDSLWKILKFGMEQKEVLWEMIIK